MARPCERSVQRMIKVRFDNNSFPCHVLYILCLGCSLFLCMYFIHFLVSQLLLLSHLLISFHAYSLIASTGPTFWSSELEPYSLHSSLSLRYLLSVDYYTPISVLMGLALCF